MDRKPIGWLPGIVLALALALVLSLAACGEGGGGEEQLPTPTPGEEAAEPEDLTAGVTAEQLGGMALQREDVPQGLSYEARPMEAWELRATIKPKAGYHVNAYPSDCGAEEGDLVCVESELLLYESVAAAQAFWMTGEFMYSQFREDASGETGFREVSVPPIADQTMAYLASSRPYACGDPCNWENSREMEWIILWFRKGSLAVSVTAYTLEQGASPDLAVELARKQLARIDAALGE